MLVPNKKWVVLNVIILSQMATLFLKAQVFDTIKLEFNQILILPDTVYFGLQDSLILLPENSEYKISKNILIKKNTDKVSKDIKSSFHDSYMDLWRSQYIGQEETDDLIESDSTFTLFEGKIIRNIGLKQVDMFEGNVNDTSQKSISSLGKAANNWHSDTRPWVIRQYYRFGKNALVDPREISDIERILRSQAYLEDARIFVVPVNQQSDSVDLLVVTKDNFPIGLGGDIRDYNYFIAEPYTRNFLGLGHNLSLMLLYKGNETEKVGYGAKYKVTNVLGTYTDISLEYSNTYRSEYTQFILGRPYISATMKIGGELNIQKITARKGTVYYLQDSTFVDENDFSMESYDAWMGYSFHFSDDYRKPFVNTAFRMGKENYLSNPHVSADSNFLFHDQNAYLGAITLQRIHYLKARKIFGFGVVEDIPVGYNFQFTTGIHQTNFYRRKYAGLQYLTVNRFNKNSIYLFSVGIGGFYRDGQMEDLLTGAGMNYFSPLFNIRNIQFRQIISLSGISVYNPLYNREINFGNTIRKLNQAEIHGQSRLVLRLQPVLFTKMQFLGFKIAEKPFCDMGWISQQEFLRGRKDFYSIFGITTSIKNESLALPALNIGIGYSPNENNADKRWKFEISLRDDELFRHFFSMKPKLITTTDF